MSIHGLHSLHDPAANVAVLVEAAAAAAAVEIDALLGKEEEVVSVITACGRSVG